jgi:hypothetical protein
MAAVQAEPWLRALFTNNNNNTHFKVLYFRLIETRTVTRNTDSQGRHSMKLLQIEHTDLPATPKDRTRCIQNT